MTATLDDVTKKKPPVEEPAELRAARELVRQAKAQGLSLVGPDGLLKQLTKTVLETALNEELTEHLGHEYRAPAAGGNVRNGTRPKTVLTESSGHVDIEVSPVQGNPQATLEKARTAQRAALAPADPSGQDRAVAAAAAQMASQAQAEMAKGTGPEGGPEEGPENGPEKKGAPGAADAGRMRAYGRPSAARASFSVYA